jgi:RNA polymerase sigma factor (sigma-70 family)
VEADSAADWQLERAVAALPDGARLAFVLHDVQGYRCQEIAALTGVSVGTIKSQLHRARRLLREMLALHGAAADLRSVQT